MGNKCNSCIHKSEVGIYNLETCIRCDGNPFVVDDRFKAREIEIKPEEEGELWFNSNTKAWRHTIKSSSTTLFMVELYDVTYDYKDVIHGQNGWTRLYPLVEDENVERVVVNDVRDWRMCGDTSSSSIYKVDIPDGYIDQLEGIASPMKMILEIPREVNRE